ncbi:hypothetical protein LAZ67_19002228 [Cordylochernes scorpioides]|uniref:Uncharacterized protein n=1 Tax=Cordylochernes scorpioides TaxID=51811 RepID=A0ABY6LIC9_9ARAC|nr:hypothetical protein LAZ67_19002228 [Cordylochernes scorpioides]
MSQPSPLKLQSSEKISGNTVVSISRRYVRAPQGHSNAHPHDNAHPHTAHLVTSFSAKNGTEILPQPPYSPDIAPNDFFLSPKLKAVLKGRHFDTRDDNRKIAVGIEEHSKRGL